MLCMGSVWKTWQRSGAPRKCRDRAGGGKGNRGSVGWQEDNIHRVKAKKSGISSQLFLVVGLALLRRLEDVEHP